jgi:hypothetical protein
MIPSPKAFCRIYYPEVIPIFAHNLFIPPGITFGLVDEKINIMDKHYPDTNLEFIRKKIYELNTALMYSMGHEPIRTPNAVITAQEVDNEGNLWFSFRSALPCLNEYEECLPVRLNFFRKGIPFYMQVSGKATVIKNEEEKRRYVAGDNHAVLMKMNMMFIEYAEPAIRRKTRLDILAENLFSWFIRVTALPKSSTSVLAKLHHSNTA